MFNPFHKPVLDRVLSNLSSSLQRAEREIVVVYYNSVFDLQEAASFLRKAWTGKARGRSSLQPVAVYRNDFKQHSSTGSSIQPLKVTGP
jgi:hypothetical protein